MTVSVMTSMSCNAGSISLVVLLVWGGLATSQGICTGVIFYFLLPPAFGLIERTKPVLEGLFASMEQGKPRDPTINM